MRTIPPTSLGVFAAGSGLPRVSASVSLIALVCTLFTLPGCGQARPVPAEGSLSLNGVPLADIGIKFVPADAPKWRGDPIYKTPWAITDAQGRFQMVHGVQLGGPTDATTNKAPGVQPGTYKVVLSRYPAVSRELTPNAPGFSTHRFTHLLASERPTRLSKLEWEWLRNPKREILKMTESTSGPGDSSAVEGKPLPAKGLPARFFLRETTPLTVNVPADGRTDIRLEISSESEQ